MHASFVVYCGCALQVLAAVEDSYGEVDEAKKETDALEWDMRNEQRRLAAESQNPTPVKSAAQQSARAQQSLAAASRLLQDKPAADAAPSRLLRDKPAADAQQRSGWQAGRKTPAVTDVIELDSDSS